MTTITEVYAKERARRARARWTSPMFSPASMDRDVDAGAEPRPSTRGAGVPAFCHEVPRGPQPISTVPVPVPPVSGAGTAPTSSAAGEGAASGHDCQVAGAALDTHPQLVLPTTAAVSVPPCLTPGRHRLGGAS